VGSEFASERDRHLYATGPKRILSLDGGGVRGVISIAYLERIEAILRQRHGPEFRLCDYFDLIGGTSTGSIIATGLAMGMEMSELVHIYVALARDCFHGSRWHGGIFVPKFRTKPLMESIRRHVGAETLGSEKLRTGLGIVAKRIDTRSVWVFHNHPRGPYFDSEPDSDAVPNKDLPLVELIRASTAAPTFFAPEHIRVARGVAGVFIDGGVSPHNNPALLLFMLATLKGYGFRWPSGDDNMLLVSVGTGYRPAANHPLPPIGSPSAALALVALHSMMDDGSRLAQTMLQWLGSSQTPWQIDGEVGNLADDHLGERAALRYLRYDLVLERAWLERELGLNISARELKAFCAIDRPEVAVRLLEVGREAAARQIKPEHLPDAFDVGMSKARVPR
jgi:hypothetical protein